MPSGHFGGTSAISGGGIWIPDNHQISQLGGEDSEEKSISYLKNIIGHDPGDDRLDVLVNSATALPDQLVQSGPFWSKGLSMLKLLDVGMCSTYVASYYAARIMSELGEGLIVNISSFGARCYMHGPAYGRV